MNYSLASILLIAALALGACAGPAGPQGERGNTGNTGNRQYGRNRVEVAVMEVEGILPAAS
ncbi:hypothetical protein [Quatrionicoccus australiensis]|uniref:hypothetical protein n=1 Tax=Quatrionicoccus australiensis TaxID=138118 RepID=UPI001CF7EE13|nr:hypothetical protein [Quatrionicoccus australiensis]UCV16911.1 hypothetical protein KI612_09680 [Quatrionicoccus australiensis]